MKKFWYFQDVPDSQWNDWKWQIKNRLRNNSDLRTFFPNISDEELSCFNDYIVKFSLAITPYTLSLIELDQYHNPIQNDPIWNQFRYLAEKEMGGMNDYNGQTENWESPDELPTKILQHKYPDRAIFRITNQCFGHCNYCYLTARVLDLDLASARQGGEEEWERSLLYLKSHPEIRDVLISGGEPLFLSNDRIQRILRDLSQISSIKSIRLNTRALTFNPYRIDKELLTILKKYRLSALEIHLAHPREINDVFDQVLESFDSSGFRPLILWRSPLLHGINDQYEVLEELLLKLYQRRITPYYLFHYAPYALGRSNYGVSIREGVELLLKLRRAIPGPAFPRFTLFHVEGKQDIPLDLEGTPTFQYIYDENYNPMVRFKNWKGKWVTYPDVRSKIIDYIN